MFGSHLSIAGGMHHALVEAEKLKLDCVQVFTKNQQQWKAPPLKPDAIAEWKSHIQRLGWHAGPPRVTSHASYLINMASPDDALRAQSMTLMRDEIDRCEALDIPLLVFHPGAHTTGTREDGIARIADACARLIKDTAGYRTVLCLENVAGAGSHIGRTFEELGHLRTRIATATGAPDRIGFCIDSCHAHAAGYDLSTPALAAAALQQFDSSAGIANIRCLHLNDSKGAVGSRLDRHEHIGKGTIGKKSGGGFPALVNHPHLQGVPKIMETPKGEDAKGTPFDTINVRKLRKMVVA